MPSQKNSLLASTIFKLRHEFLNQTSKELLPKIWGNLTESTQKTIVTVVIPSRGCSWALSKNGGCSVCGYVNDSSRGRSIPSEQIITKITDLLNQTDPNKLVELKIFNSGSFFDEVDVPRNLRLEIINYVKKNPNIFQLTVESRPGFILHNINIVKETKKMLGKIHLEIGIGLESSNNAILRDCLNKGTTFEEFIRSVKILHSIGILIKSYILIKPPFLTEMEAINDAVSTAYDAINAGTDVLSFNPCNVQNGTLVHHLQKKNQYQPPWLWSILFIIKTVRQKCPDIEIICEPIAAGKQRGSHNCGKCDKEVLDLINKVLINEQIPEDLSGICSCFLIWQFLISTPIEVFRTRNQSKLRLLNPLQE
ncbi:MAG: archaeosine biosynthesis radical SAM protein RaSEA [Candidatus Hermodarchaeota archaeon]